MSGFWWTVSILLGLAWFAGMGFSFWATKRPRSPQEWRDWPW